MRYFDHVDVFSEIIDDLQTAEQTYELGVI